MLEELNFNEPISATLIFDDSDEETKSGTEDLQTKLCIEDLHTKEPGAKDNIASHSIKELENKNLELKKYLSMPETYLKKVEEEIKINESQTEALGNFIIRRKNSDGEWVIVGNDEANIGESTTKKQIETPLDMPPLEDSTLSNSKNLQNTNSLSAIDTNIKPDTQTEKSKRKKSLNEGKFSKRKLGAHIETKEVKSCDKNLNYIEINPTSNQNYNQAASRIESSPVVLQQLPLLEKYSDTAQQTRKNQRIQHEQQTNALDLLPRSLKFVNQSAIQYASSSLQSVSEHLIYIINSYQSYVTMCKTGAEQSLIEHSKKQFINTKKHFFDLSYNSVVTIILPKENDMEFVKTFIDNSIKLAYSKLLPYTYTHLYPLYLELVHWAKKKQKYIEGMNLANSNPEITQLLQQSNLQPPAGYNIKPNQNTTLQNEFQKQNHTIARNCFSHDSFGMTQTNIIGSTYISRSQPRYAYAMQPKSLPTYGQSQMYNMQQAKANFSCVSNQIHQSTQFELDKSLQLQSLRNMENERLRNNGSSWNNTAPTTTVQSSQKEIPVPNESIFSYQNNALANLNTALRYQRYEEAVPSQNRQNLRLEIPPQVEANRSSISRDSGFMSPFDFNASSDQSSNIQAEQSSHPSPFITHVTSLHPSAQYIEDGSCVVCGKTTKKKCVGCYKFYYCSRDCQYKDWNKHMPHCNQQNENNV